MTKEEIVKILESYTSKTRGVIEWGGCRYYVPETGNRCAIGALLPLEDAQWLAAEEYGSIESVYRDLDNPEMPKSIVDLCNEHPEKFLTDIQRIHDWEENWGPDGLTDEGKELILELKLFWKCA